VLGFSYAEPVATDDTTGTAYKDLCLDSSEVPTAAAFWAPVLGLEVQWRGGNALLTDDVDEHTVWLNAVPERKSVKNRVHLDVHAAAVTDLLALGARVLDDSQPWTVLADPEGAEFCAFQRAPGSLPRYRLYELVVDSVDPEMIAGWWAERFGVEPQRDGDVEAQRDVDDDAWFLSGVPGMPWEVVFGAVPEPKTAKNRVHWDLLGSTSELVGAGATLLRARDDEISWDVLADPEGNEFCVFTRE